MPAPKQDRLSLSQLQNNCARYSATLKYILAEKNCKLFWQTLKSKEKQDFIIPHIKMCGFYIGLLNTRLNYEHKKNSQQSLTQMINSIAANPQPLPSRFEAEEAMMLLLKTFDIEVNIETTCKKAAYQNSGYAMEVLGDYYEEAYNYEEAIYWYRRAIESYRIAPQYGGFTAAYALGSLLALAPTKALRNPEKAAALFLQSVAIGDDSFIASYLKNTNCKNCLPLATRLYMQSLLKQHGLYTGYLDGDFGENTIKGITDLYQNPQNHSTAIAHFQRQAHHSFSNTSPIKTSAHVTRKPSFYKKPPLMTANTSSSANNTGFSWLQE